MCYKNKEQFENAQKYIGRGRVKIRETAYWDQLFPAGKKIEIGHEYTPLAGFEFSISKKDASKMCLDKGTENAFYKLARAKLKQDKTLTVFTTNHYDVSYVLGTGRNWKGPIKNFKLILRKSSSDQLISLCFPGKLQRTSPFTFEFTQSDYVPQDELFVSFINVAVYQNAFPVSGAIYNLIK